MSDIVKDLEDLADCDARAGAPLGKAMREAAAEIRLLRAKLAKAVEVMNTYCDPMNMEPKHDQFLSQLNKEFPDE